MAHPAWSYYRAWVKPDRPQPLWRGPLTAAERRTVFDGLRGEVARLYPYFREKGIDWPATAAAFWPRAEAAASDGEFYAVLREMLAALQDGHKSEDVAAALRKQVGVATEAHAEAMQAMHLLRGPSGTQAVVRFRRPDGEEYVATLSRTLTNWGDQFEAYPVEGFGYVRIPVWSGLVDQQFEQALEQFQHGPGLIIDVRGNGCGNDALAERVIGRLIGEPTLWSRIRLRFGPYRTFWMDRTVEPRGPWRYEGPVVLLIDGEVYSSNDFFVGGLVRSGRAVAIGTATAGGSGNAAQITLPGGAKVRISRWQEAFADGTLVEGNGNRPTIEVRPTVADLAAGRDPVLERAVRYLKETQ